jgi:hypothetical protein
MRSTTVALVALVLLGVVCTPALAKKDKKGPKITTKVFFDITIGGKEAGTSPPRCMARFGVCLPATSRRRDGH